MFLELIPQHGTAILFSDLQNLLSLGLIFISTSISKLLKILANNFIFLQQELHCYLQSLYFKLYLSDTSMFYNVVAH